jgi:hypothetical protein
MIDLDANVREYDTFIRRLVRDGDHTALVFVGPTQMELTGPSPHFRGGLRAILRREMPQ